MKKSEVLEILNENFKGDNVIDYNVMEIKCADTQLLNVYVKRITWRELHALREFILEIEPTKCGWLEIGFCSDIEID